MTAFSAQARFQLDGASEIIDSVCEHLVSHGVRIGKAGGKWALTFYHGMCEIALDGNQALLNVAAPTLTGISVIREELAGHLIEHSPELEEKIIWSGDGCDVTMPVWFCLLTVVSSQRLTPHMQRIRFRGSNLERYAGFKDIHVRLMFPHDEQAPQWPRVSPSGVTQYPEADALAIRKYTIRNIDTAAGTLDVDFVLHEDAGPGSEFAFRAKPGDVIGMGGPGGRCAPLDRDWYLFAGDETALPAIARILEALPQTADGIALIEVADPAEEQIIETKSNVEIRWLHRQGADAGTTPLLLDAVRTVDMPSEGASVFAWAGCEHDTCMSIRSYLRKERGLNKGDDLVVSYWRRGEG